MTHEKSGAGTRTAMAVEAALVSALLVFAFLLRLPGMGRPAWMDEVITLGWAQKGYLEIFRNNTTPFMPATAKTMLLFFRSDAIANETLLRMPHLVFGLAGIAVLYIGLRRRLGILPAFASSLFLATLPLHVGCSQESRYYAVAVLSSALLVFAVLRCAEKMRAANLLLLFAAAWLGLSNHLSFTLVLAAAAPVGAAALLFRPGIPPLRRVRQSVIFSVVAALGAGAALAPVFFLADTGRMTRVFTLLSLGEAAPGQDGEDGRQVNDEPPRPAAKTHRLNLPLYTDRYLKTNFLCAREPLFFLVSLLLACAGLLYLIARDRLLACLMAALLAIHVPFLLIYTRQPCSPRYFIAQAVAYAILTGAGIAGMAALAGMLRKPGRGARLAGAVLLAAGYAFFLYESRSLTFSQGKVHHVYQTDLGQKALARTIADQARPGDTIVTVGTRWGWHRILQYYLGQFLGNSPSLRFGLKWGEYESVDDFRAAVPAPGENTVWVLTYGQTEWKTGFEEMGRTAAVLHHSEKLSALWVVGRRTVNMLDGGDFEHGREAVALPEFGKIVPLRTPHLRGESLCVTLPGEASLEMSDKSTVWFAPVRTPLGTPGPCFLETRRAYTLSFLLKTEIADADASPVFRVWIEGKDTQGAGFQRALFQVAENADWGHYELFIEPGVNAPEDGQTFRIGMGGGVGPGRFWLDNVQLEARPNASPFTASIR
ncbi:MAG: hypothetical protein GXY15_16160 [Candidatus Hydrogenedentes bacterium]|nr:hypothetical protein [Candidatus Hydrogenedentota bacterium]